LEALEAIDITDECELSMHMPREAKSHWPKMEGQWWRITETRRLVVRIADERKFLSALTVAAASTWKAGQKRPATVIAYLIVKDIAAIFEWCTGLEATRQVDRISHEETGPFYPFAAAIWPVIFGKGDDGLPAAIKNFAKHRDREGRALIANIALRNPTWKLFEPK
jgi:hypothetical protein